MNKLPLRLVKAENLKIGDIVVYDGVLRELTRITRKRNGQGVLSISIPGRTFYASSDSYLKVLIQ